jgi:hypothetical protein
VLHSLAHLALALAESDMKLVDDIIELATEDKESVSVLLRKCLVLSYSLNNERLKTWAEKELDGYEKSDDIPQYRIAHSISKGTFLAGGGGVLNDQPLNPQVMDDEHRHFATTVKLNAPIASYELGLHQGATSNPIVPWPPAITARYQTKFIKGWALNRAWQELPASIIVGLVATVRNRILRFALELRLELGSVHDNIADLKPATIDRTVTNYIYGAQNVFAGSAQSVTQIGSIVVGEHDLDGLKRALSTLGVADADVAELAKAIEHDSRGGTPSLGDCTKGWLKALPGKLASGVVTVGADVAKATAKQWLMQYFGIDV